MRSRGSLLLGLLLLTGLASGCLASEETRAGADRLEEALGTPDWATGVSVTSGRDGQLADQVLTEVTLGDSVEADDISEFIVAMPGHVVDAGLDDVPANKNLSFVLGDARLDVQWEPDVVPDEVARGIDEWVRVIRSDARGIAATLRSDGGASYVLTLGDAYRSTVGDQVEVLRDVSEPDTAWQIDASADGIAFELSGTVLPNGKQLGVWRSLIGALDQLPVDLPASGLSLHLLDRTVADVTLLVPDDTTDETFTIEAYGDRVWPAVRPQLDAMRRLSGEWSYFASWAPRGTPTSRNLFISLLTDLPTTDNGDEATRWSTAAKDYLDHPDG